MNFEEWAIENGHSVERIASTGEYHCRLTRRAAAAWQAARQPGAQVPVAYLFDYKGNKFVGLAETVTKPYADGLADEGTTYRPLVFADTAPPAQRIDTLCGRLQQKCADWGTYWRAPDAHGVNLNIEQALELLRDALGVEVYIDLMMFEPAVDALYSKQVGEYEDGKYGDEELARIEEERFDMMQLIRRTSP